MARFTDANLVTAHEIIALYPVKKSATIPLLHLAQEQDGWVTEAAMEHIAELVDLTAAQVLGTCSFYEMFKLEPVGRYVVNICTNISCLVLGAEELLDHAETTLGIRAGGTTTDGMFSLGDVECIAACTEAPCLQVNYRYFDRVTPQDFDELVDDLRAGRRTDDIPDHGVIARNRQNLPADRAAGPADPAGVPEPVWLARNTADEGAETP